MGAVARLSRTALTIVPPPRYIELGPGHGTSLIGLGFIRRRPSSTEYVSPTGLTYLYTGMGEKEGAMASLEEAYAARDSHLQTLKIDTHVDSLRSEPRFQDLLRRVGLHG